VRIRVAPTAARQIREAGEWWVVNRAAVPTLFRDELQRAFILVRGQPAIGARATNAKLEGVRRVRLSRIGYHLYYRIGADGDSIEVLALWHSRRGASPL